MPRGRELPVAGAIAALCLVLAIQAPGYFSAPNLTDLFLSNVPALIVALGMTLVILTGEIDISVGSAFAVSSVLAGVAAKSGLPALPVALGAGAAIGALNGALVSFARIPSIVVTLAALVALRDALRWATQGSWIEDLPAGFQWLGWSQRSYAPLLFALSATLVLAMAWTLQNLAAGRAIYATGSNEEAARLAGWNTRAIKFSAFAVLGALTGLAAALNAARFNQIPSNTGLGLEMKVIASVVVGGTAVTGGSGSITGTLLGVVLMGMIGPALTFLGVNAYWEKAIQGLIILTAIAVDAIRSYRGARLAAA
jgi:rhamnose transport system permease protein